MPTLQTGEIVRVRSRQFLVEAVTPARQGDEQTLVTLSCVDDDAQGERLQVLWERETDARVLKNASWDAVKRLSFDKPRRLAAYLHAQRWNCVTATDPDLFQAPHRAGIQIQPYQLEPLRKALRMPRVNLFIADDVGLGKTIEAGLILRELLMRQRAHRVVVAAPPSVMLQWKDELETRFGLSFVIFDREFVTRRRRERGWTLNPWSTHSRFIISHALLRDEHYASTLRAWLDDGDGGALLILDEAHHVAPSSGSHYAIDSRLTRVVRDLAPRFEHRLFLSATPHNGHSNSFAALLEILDPQRFCRGVPVRGRHLLSEVMVRRLKSDLRAVGSGNFALRKVVQIDLDGLPPDAPELRLPALLDQYRTLRLNALQGATEAVQREVLLVVTALQKRLLSSLDAFARTLAVHHDTLRRQRAKRAAVTAPATQLSLDAPGPDDEVDAGSEDEASARQLDELADATARLVTPAALHAREDALLDAMRELVEPHRHRPDAKVKALLQWIREHLLDEGGRWNTTRVVIFTEYTDTKNWLVRCLREALAETERADDRVATLHGQMGDEAREAVKRAFNSEPERHPLRILVATDAAREGVNLQNRCADLFHFDVPWNPSRMEQRNGRIDRTLQRAPEVRCHYFVHLQRPEDQVLAALVAKTERIRRELGSLSEVIEQRLSDVLAQGIRRDEADARAALIEQLPLAGVLDASGDEGDECDEVEPSEARVVEELEVAREAPKGLQERLNELAELLDRAKDRLKIDPARLHNVLDAALAMMGESPLRPVATGGDEARRYEFPPLDRRDPAWADALDALRPPRPREISVRQWRRESALRPVVFRDPGSLDGEVVHLHLEHAVVRRLLGRLLAQGFVHEDLSRACVIPSDDNVKRVVLVGRLSLFGDAAARLHDQLVFVSAQWTGAAEHRAEALKPYGRTTHEETLAKLDALLVAPRDVDVPESLQSLFQASVARDVDELVPALKARAVAEAETARTLLERRAVEEAQRMTELLLAQRTRIKNSLAKHERADTDPQRAMAWRDELPAEARRQLDSDRLHWRRRLDAIEHELSAEPARIRDSYEVRATRVDPIAVVYLARVS